MYQPPEPSETSFLGIYPFDIYFDYQHTIESTPETEIITRFRVLICSMFIMRINFAHVTGVVSYRYRHRTRLHEQTLTKVYNG